MPRIFRDDASLPAARIAPKMVLVDTSVWIRHLYGVAPYELNLKFLLSRREAAGHCLVRGELLMGNQGQRDTLLAHYETIPWVRMIADDQVAAFVRQRGLAGRGIGWIDAHLLASALVAGHALWSADEALTAIARELKVIYTPAMLEK